jgi:hypothetical protein
VLVEDEARMGQQGTLTRVWARTGSRPTAVKQTEYQWLHVWAAIEPVTGESWTMLTPDMNTTRMNTLLAGISGTLEENDLAVLVLDNAGWHRAKALQIPANIVLLFLPPYSPELQPAERLWAWMRSHHLSNRIYVDYDDMLQAADTSIQTLDNQRLKTLCACSWLTPQN